MLSYINNVLKVFIALIFLQWHEVSCWELHNYNISVIVASLRNILCLVLCCIFLCRNTNMPFLLPESLPPFAWKGKKQSPCPHGHRRSTSTYVELQRHAGENNSSGLFFSCAKQLNGSVCVHICIYVRVCQRALLSANMGVLVCVCRSYSKGEIFDYIVFTYPSDPNDLSIEHWSRQALRSLHLQSYTV